MDPSSREEKWSSFPPKCWQFIRIKIKILTIFLASQTLIPHSGGGWNIFDCLIPHFLRFPDTPLPSLQDPLVVWPSRATVWPACHASPTAKSSWSGPSWPLQIFTDSGGAGKMACLQHQTPSPNTSLISNPPYSRICAILTISDFDHCESKIRTRWPMEPTNNRCFFRIGTLPPSIPSDFLPICVNGEDVRETHCSIRTSLSLSQPQDRSGTEVGLEMGQNMESNREYFLAPLFVSSTINLKVTHPSSLRSRRRGPYRRGFPRSKR